MKKIILPVLLVILTLFIILIPPFLSGQNKRNIADETTYRDYTAGKRTSITSEQVAKLYYNQEISMVYDYFDIKTVNKEEIHNNIIDLTEMLFDNNKEACEAIKKILLSNNDYYDSNKIFNNYSRKSILIKVDNQPAALNFVHYYIENENGYLVIRYEEKTKTVISFTCTAVNVPFENADAAISFPQKTAEILSKHYENYVDKNGYYVNLNDPKNLEDTLVFWGDEATVEGYISSSQVTDNIKNDSETGCSTTVTISCGLAQRSNKIFYVE